MKRCSQCNFLWPLSRFYKRAASIDGLQPLCKHCDNMRKDKHRKSYGRPKNPEAIRRVNLKSKFGISVEEYDEILARQNNCCAICKRHQAEFDRNFAVDHDHEFGYNRGLLCVSCNNMLGRARDSIEVLENAIAYLKEHEV